MLSPAAADSSSSSSSSVADAEPRRVVFRLRSFAAGLASWSRDSSVTVNFRSEAVVTSFPPDAMSPCQANMADVQLSFSFFFSFFLVPSVSSTKRGMGYRRVRPSVCLSVCLSVTLCHKNRPTIMQFSPNGSTMALYFQVGYVQMLRKFEGRVSPLANNFPQVGLPHITFRTHDDRRQTDRQTDRQTQSCSTSATVKYGRLKTSFRGLRPKGA